MLKDKKVAVERNVKTLRKNLVSEAIDSDSNIDCAVKLFLLRKLW